MPVLYRLAEMVIEPRRILGLATLPSFLTGFATLRRRGEPATIADMWPMLGDRRPRTPFDPHYFFQAAWLARQLAMRRPAAHTDVGSDVRLIAAISGMVPVTFLDFRPLLVTLPNLNCVAGDICALPWDDRSVPSLSCLHVIEHVGLGRYGDPIDPQGSRRALAELVRVLAPGGTFYLTTPVGQPRTQYNAHRIFDALAVLQLAAPLELESFAMVDDHGQFHSDCTPDRALGLKYGCGMFVLRRPG